jgi:WD40 repeat protein
VRVWDPATGEQIRAWQAHDQTINSVAFAPHGQLLVTGSDDSSIRLWNPITGEPIASVPCRSAVNRLRFSRGGELLALGTAAGLIQIWHVADLLNPAKEAKPIHDLQGHTDAITGLDFGADAKRLVSAGSDGGVKIWDVTAGDEVLTFRLLSGDNTRVRFSPNGQLLTATVAQSIAVWDIARDRNGPAQSPAITRHEIADD